MFHKPNAMLEGELETLATYMSRGRPLTDLLTL